MIGVFVPMFDPPRNGKGSARVGWITDANGCDIWQGCRTGGGYAQVWDGKRVCLVQRVRYEREIGPIPGGLPLDHFICDNGPGGCCNPFHCRPVTHRENILRGNGRTSGFAARTHCPEGHLLAGANLLKTKGRHRACRTCKNVRQNARYHANKPPRRPPKTHCPKGHPLADGNLVKYRLARGEKVCRICRNASALAWSRAKKARQA